MLRKFLARYLNIPGSGDGEAQQMLLGEILSRQVQHLTGIQDLREAEFKVFSQFGDDGIIQFLIHSLRLKNETFIEFGVENYREANTRFLLQRNNWKGLVMDSSKDNIDFIRRDPMYWRHDLAALQCFVTRDNINGIIEEAGFTGDVGLLSIDIDGNDYWVWDSIQAVQPDMVIVEYNSVFGSDSAVTVPYDPAFNRTKAHYSNLYWGCSLKALCMLAAQKGYAFVGSNSHGNNAYFVRNDRLGGLKSKTAKEGYRESRFRESRDEKGSLTFLSGRQRLKMIEDMVIFDIENRKNIFIKELT